MQNKVKNQKNKVFTLFFFAIMIKSILSGGADDKTLFCLHGQHLSFSYGRANFQKENWQTGRQGLQSLVKGTECQG